MILKKPYAFLIKHFRLINLILGLLMGFVFYKTYQVLNFFNQYIHNNYMGNFDHGFYQSYISFLLYLVLFLIIIGISAILLLFIYKKKPSKMYAISLVYYIALFILFMIARSNLITLETSTLGVNLARGLRDVIIIFLLPQIPFIIMFIIRGLGFNIYKFRFNEDLKDLELSALDNEEVEVVIKNDGTVLKRNVRRFFREFTYYLKENKFMLILIIIIAVLALAYFIYTKTRTSNYDNTYKEGITFNSLGLDYTVVDSLITNMDYNGNYFTDNAYYVIIRLKVDNNNYEDDTFDLKKFRLEVADELLYPTQDLGNNFIDFSPVYTTPVVKKNSSNEFSLIYKINEDVINKKLRLKIDNGFVYHNNGTTGKYIYIKLDPDIATNIEKVGDYKINQAISFKDSYLNDTSIKLNNMINTERYIYDYEYCSDTCRTFKDKLTTDYQNNKTLLIFTYEYKIDTQSAYYKYGQSVNRFLENFVLIKYMNDGKYVYEDVKNVTPNNLKGKIALEVTNKINSSEEVYLSFIIRNKEYLMRII